MCCRTLSSFSYCYRNQANSIPISDAKINALYIFTVLRLHLAKIFSTAKTVAFSRRSKKRRGLEVPSAHRLRASPSRAEELKNVDFNSLGYPARNARAWNFFEVALGDHQINFCEPPTSGSKGEPDPKGPTRENLKQTGLIRH